MRGSPRCGDAPRSLRSVCARHVFASGGGVPACRRLWLRRFRAGRGVRSGRVGRCGCGGGPGDGCRVASVRPRVPRRTALLPRARGRDDLRRYDHQPRPLRRLRRRVRGGAGDRMRPGLLRLWGGHGRLFRRRTLVLLPAEAGRGPSLLREPAGRRGRLRRVRTLLRSGGGRPVSLGQLRLRRRSRGMRGNGGGYVLPDGLRGQHMRGYDREPEPLRRMPGVLPAGGNLPAVRVYARHAGVLRGVRLRGDLLSWQLLYAGCLQWGQLRRLPGRWSGRRGVEGRRPGGCEYGQRHA
jgi:hypothetical protein